ncbi:hypothetical protein EJC51_26395 [Streptomyces aquilus]|uniref:Uncharacterized protein n=1 Tax=Streptomyces aquilus TaxID=2548456 RepID=A0A3S9I4I1_9ACTN|nr:DUF5955 family protein [Streptomyces aquilus]AZP19290.1 hypothetical protein EJC51_26395 [Streptomyces aquilus]
MPQESQGNDNRVKAKYFTNSGAYAPGGTANYTAAPVSSEAAELRQRLDDLRGLLVQYAAALPDPDQLRDDTDQLDAQLQRERPNRTVVRGLLDSLTAGAGGVSAVASAVSTVVQLVSRFLP